MVTVILPTLPLKSKHGVAPDSTTNLSVKEWFNRLTLTELATLTGVHKTQWCKWFRGKAIGEDALNRAAASLSASPLAPNISAGTLLDLIQCRRLETQRIKADGYNYTPKQYDRRQTARTQSA